MSDYPNDFREDNIYFYSVSLLEDDGLWYALVQYPSPDFFDFESAGYGTSQEYKVYEDHLLRVEWCCDLVWPRFIQKPEDLAKYQLRPAIAAKSYDFMRSLAYAAHGLISGHKQEVDIHHANQVFQFLKYTISFGLTGHVGYYRQMGALSHYVQMSIEQGYREYFARTSKSPKEIDDEQIKVFLQACRLGDFQNYLAILQIILDKRKEIPGIDFDEINILEVGIYFYYHNLIYLGLCEAVFHRHFSISESIVTQGLYPRSESVSSSREIWPANGSWHLHRQIEHESAAGQAMDHRGVAFWVEHGEDINEINLCSRTPLDLAIERGHLAAIQYLRPLGAKTFLEIANSIVFGLDEEVDKYGSEMTEKGRFYRHHSYYHRSLVEASVPFSQQEMKAKPFIYPLPEVFLQACANGDRETAQQIVASGLDLIYAHDALDLAIQASCFEIIRLIIQNGLHVSLLRPHLLKLVSGQYNNLSFVDDWLEVMVKQGTAVNFFDIFTDPIHTPLDHALAEKNETWIKLLKLSGAKTYQEILLMELG
jgi:ankyrin repeat protein